jgi:ribonucleoside-diphosphate reductase alpha chain
MIALFSPTDGEMLYSKHGQWWVENPQRARANNSVILLRRDITKEDFDALFEVARTSGAGEPGVLWTNDLEYGANPCNEVSLRPYTFCNLNEINMGTVESQEDLEERAALASFLGTLQASYTDFPFLREEWKRNTEEDALVGIGLTGIASQDTTKYDLMKAAFIATEANKMTASMIGINPAKRVTTVKPSGTSSLILGTSSGIHGWHAPYYIRRIRYNASEPIVDFLLDRIPRLMEIDEMDQNNVVVSFPVKAPSGAILRSEPLSQMLSRVSRYNAQWVAPGHFEGPNHNNVSVTVSVREDEWDYLREWMWNQRHNYNGISVLPYDGGTYTQAPFEEIDEETYNHLMKYMVPIDFTQMVEHEDNTNLQGEAACAGGACEI